MPVVKFFTSLDPNPIIRFLDGHELDEPECLCLSNSLLTIMRGEFPVNVVGVSFNGSRGDKQPLRNLLVAQSIGQEIDDIELPVCQRSIRCRK